MLDIRDHKIGVSSNPFSKSGVIKTKLYANATFKKYDAVALDDYGRATLSGYSFNNNPGAKFVNNSIASLSTTAYEYRADMIQLDQDHYVMAFISGSTMQVDVYKKTEPVRSNATLTKRATNSNVASSVEGLSLCKVNDSLFAITYRGASGYWYCIIGEFNAGTAGLTFGTPFTIYSGAIYSETPTAVSLGNNRIVVFATRYDVGQIYGRIIDVIDKNSVVQRTLTNVAAESGVYLEAVALNSTEIILAYSSGSTGRAVGVDVSGNSLVPGAAYTFYPNQAAYGLDLKVWKGNTAFATYRDGSNPMYVRISKITKIGASLSTTWTAMPDNVGSGTTQVVIPREDVGFVFGLYNGSVYIWPFTIDAYGNYTLKNYLSSFYVSSLNTTHILPINPTIFLIMNDAYGYHNYGFISDLYFKDIIGIALNDATTGQTVEVALL